MILPFGRCATMFCVIFWYIFSLCFHIFPPFPITRLVTESFGGANFVVTAEAAEAPVDAKSNFLNSAMVRHLSDAFKNLLPLVECPAEDLGAALVFAIHVQLLDAGFVPQLPATNSGNVRTAKGCVGGAVSSPAGASVSATDEDSKASKSASDDASEWVLLPDGQVARVVFERSICGPFTSGERKIRYTAPIFFTSGQQQDGQKEVLFTFYREEKELLVKVATTEAPEPQLLKSLPLQSGAPLLKLFARSQNQHREEKGTHGEAGTGAVPTSNQKVAAEAAVELDECEKLTAELLSSITADVVIPVLQHPRWNNSRGAGMPSRNMQQHEYAEASIPRRRDDSNSRTSAVPPPRVGEEDLLPGGYRGRDFINPGGGQSGGMMLGPRHPYFTGGNFTPGRLGGEPVIPMGNVPPGAHYDPIGPFGHEPPPDHAHPPLDAHGDLAANAAFDDGRAAAAAAPGIAPDPRQLLDRGNFGPNPQNPSRTGGPLGGGLGFL